MLAQYQATPKASATELRAPTKLGRAAGQASPAAGAGVGRSRAPGISRVDNGPRAPKEPEPQPPKAEARDYAALEKTLKTKSLVQLRGVYNAEHECYDEAREVAEQKIAEISECREEQKLARERVMQAEAVERELRQEAAAVAADVAVLGQGLPTMLQGRCDELNAQVAEVRALTQECATARSKQCELEKVRDRCREQVDSLWHQAEDWRQRNRPMPRQRSAVDERLWSLSERCKRASNRAAELETSIQCREDLHARHVEELAQLKWRAGGLRTQLDVARRRHEESATEAWEQTESFCLAKRLEIEGLRRALSLRHQHLQVKSREASFYQEKATSLNAELEAATVARDREVSELMRPPSYTPAMQNLQGRPEGPRPEAMQRTGSGQALRVNPVPLSAQSPNGKVPQVARVFPGAPVVQVVSSPVPSAGLVANGR